jgi:hypothetical protein
MTFEEWCEIAVRPELTEDLRAAEDAGQRSGFSLGTEAAAKACSGNCLHGCAEKIRALRYEDVKGEKDG